MFKFLHLLHSIIILPLSLRLCPSFYSFFKIPNMLHKISIEYNICISSRTLTHLPYTTRTYTTNPTRYSPKNIKSIYRKYHQQLLLIKNHQKYYITWQNCVCLFFFSILYFILFSSILWETVKMRKSKKIKMRQKYNRTRQRQFEKQFICFKTSKRHDGGGDTRYDCKYSYLIQVNSTMKFLYIHHNNPN